MGALCQAASDALDARFNPVTVVGELSGVTRASSGHCYFTLKDERAQLRCAMFRRAASLLNFQARDGDRVEIRGRLAVYEPRGDLQLVVESMVRSGAGALLERFMLLKAKLEAQGLFANERKRSIAPMPRTVGVVTSLGAAALHDVVSALQRRAPHVQVVLAPAQVQGQGSAQEVVAALRSLYALCAGGFSQAGLVAPPETILLVRGGGSPEDLWTFNEEAVVRAVAESPVPVVSGIGHETDFTLTDFAADLRAPTPTAAAELVCSARDEQWQALQALGKRWHSATHRSLERLEQRLDVAALRLGRPMTAVAAARARCAHLQYVLQTRTERELGLWRQRWQLAEQAWQAGPQARLRDEMRRIDHLGVRLSAVDPALVLQRGYAWLADDGGRPVSSVAALRTGQRLQASLADGRVDLAVTNVKPQ